jgi:hypothetical protein
LIFHHPIEKFPGGLTLKPPLYPLQQHHSKHDSSYTTAQAPLQTVTQMHRSHHLESHLNVEMSSGNINQKSNTLRFVALSGVESGRRAFTLEFNSLSINITIPSFDF